MTELLTAARMRAIERAAMDSGAVTGLDLMERAGRGAVDAIFAAYPGLAKSSHRAVVLCGPGNNGGDGFVVARLLRDWGWEVDVFLYGDPSKLSPDAAENHARWRRLGDVAILSMPAPSETEIAALAGRARAPTPALIVDAFFGTGLSRPIAGLDHALTAIGIDPGAERDPGGPRVVAIDMPSGLCTDSGRIIGETAVRADLTVTFHGHKLGHVLADGPDLCGDVRRVSIGLERQALDPDGPVATTAGPPGTVKRGGHKYAHGHALVLAGGPGRTGAARLAARGALRIGAGLVTVGCPPHALPEVAHHLTAIMCRPIDGATGLAATLEDGRLNALCLGPGLGLDVATRDLVLTALGADRATVLDADALTVFEEDSAALFSALHARCVLTPHAGEFARVFPDLAERLSAPAEEGPAFAKVDAVRDAAARAGCTILMKGPDTVIADSEGRTVINASVYERAAPGLATAGSGDVLAGFIVGLLARGLEPVEAAASAAWLHTECALEFGPGLIAEDLPERLPVVLARLEG